MQERPGITRRGAVLIIGLVAALALVMPATAGNAEVTAAGSMPSPSAPARTSAGTR